MSEIISDGQTSFRSDNIESIWSFAVIIAVIAGLAVLSSYSFLLFHCVVELFDILILLIIAVIALNTHHLRANSVFTAIGISFGFVAVVNFLHFFTYKEIGVFRGNIENTGVYFLIASRYLESLSLLLIPALYSKLKNKYMRLWPTVIFYLIITILIISFSFFLENFHLYFINGERTTLLNRVNELIITVIYLMAAIVLISFRKLHIPEIYNYFIIYLVFRIISQLFFLVFINVNNIYITVGHIIILISYYFIYKSLVQSSLSKPIETIFAKLNSMNLELENKTSQLMELNQELLKENAERKETERMLHQSRERYLQLIDILPDGIFVITKGTITFTNRAGLLLLGASDFHDVIGKPAMQIVHPQYHESLAKSFMEVEKKSTASYLQKIKLIKLDGTTVDVEAAGTGLVEDNCTSIIGIAYDISSQVRAEELSLSILEKESLLDKAVELDRMKTEFIANISHELRTPLNVIISTIQLASQFYNNTDTSGNSGKLSKYFNIMSQNSRRLLKLVNNLIDTTKIDAGFVQLKTENCNIVETVEDITLSVAEFIESKGISLIFDTEIEERITACDPDKIERIILNLLSNATKFTKPGGIIKVNISDMENSIIISVKDTGIGVPDDMKEAIFERFRQVDQSLTRIYEGSGIGLSLVKSLVEMHGGTIRLDSKYGQGSNFIIELPVKMVENPQTGIWNRDFTIQQSRIERIKVEFSDIYESA